MSVFGHLPRRDLAILRKWNIPGSLASKRQSPARQIDRFTQAANIAVADYMNN